MVDWKNRIVETADMAVKDLKANPKNWRKHPQAQQNALSGVLDAVGWVAPVIFNRQSGHLIDGHLRLELAVKRKEKTLPVSVVDLSPDEEAMILATFDPIAAMAEADRQMLAGLMQSIETEDAQVQALLESIAREEKIDFGPEPAEAPEPQVDRAAELQEQWQTAPGQLWQCGDHRVLCGDSTNPADVARLMGGETAIGCVTSPPYAEQRKAQYGGTPAEEYWEWFSEIQARVNSTLSDKGNFFLNIKPHAEQKQRHLYVFDLVCSMVREAGWLFVDEYCWLRTGIPQQVVNRFKNAFEPVYWFAKTGNFAFYPDAVSHESDNVPLPLGKGAGNTSAADRQGHGGGAVKGNKIAAGMAYPSNVLNFKQNAEAIGHPAAYPIQLPEFFIKGYSLPGEIWYEPFLGSGTTLIACEQLGRRCFGMEISPAYVAVILQRWHDMTGRDPVLLET